MVTRLDALMFKPQARFEVFVAVAAVAAGAGSASAGVVKDLTETIHGSPRDFTRQEREQAVIALVRVASDDKGDTSVVDEAARAVAGLLGGEFDDVVLHALERARSTALTRELRASLDRMNIDDDKDGRVVRLCQVLGNTGDAAVVPSITRVVDDGGTKELRVACLRSLARLSPTFAKTETPSMDAATRTLVRYVDHKALGKTAREVLSNMTTTTAPLRPLLNHSDPEVRAFAARLLAGTKEVADDVAAAFERQFREAKTDGDRAIALRGLGRALCGDRGSDDDNICAAAAAHRLVDVVGPVFADVNADRAAQAAIDAVARVRDRALVKPLITALAHPSQHVRSKAAELLGKIGDPTAKKALQQKLSTTKLDDGWNELDAYMHGVVGVGVSAEDAAFFAAFFARDDIANSSFSSNHPKMWEALARLPPSSSKSFIPLLRNPRRETRKSICELLGQLGDKDSGVPLLDLIERDDEVKDDAARALSGVADEHTLPRMRKLLAARLAKESWNGGGELALSFVRADRAFGLERTLAQISQQNLVGIELLRAMLKETHPSDARAFAHAFAQKNPDQSTTYTFRALAILGWARIDTPASVETLCHIATTHAEDSVRTQAATALARFPEPKALSCMVTALKKSQDKGWRGDVIRALEDATGESLGDDVKAWSTFVDGGVGLKGGEAALTAALSNPSSSVRALAARQLGKNKQGLSSLLQALPRESDAEARLEIVTAVAAHDADAAKVPLVDELERRRASWPEQIALAKALDRLGDGRGTLVLLKMMEGTDPTKAQAAMLALSEVTGEPPTSSPPFWRAWWKAHAERYRMGP